MPERAFIVLRETAKSHERDDTVPERVSIVVPRILTVPESVERDVSSQRTTPERAFCARVSV